jgi:tRNA(Ile)-lysidine synthase
MLHTLTQEFLEFLKQHNFTATNTKWLIAVSGGVDSVVLCHLCSANCIPFAMAHCNFQLRGAESESDKAFVKAFAAQLNTELFVKDFDTKKYMTETGKSVQVAARELRYAWFAELLENFKTTHHSPLTSHGFATTHVSPLTTHYIATAHHANDNIETVLMNLFRGTGIKGLRGIQPVQATIIRPLLNITKEAILDYAKTHNLSWVEDSSNSSDKYTRNFIRNKIIPLMEEAIPRDEMGFEKTMEMLSEVEMLYNEAITFHKKKLLEIKGNEIHIPVLKLSASKPLKTIVYEIIKDFGFSSLQTDDVLALLKAESGKYVASATHRIIRNRAWLIIAPQKTEEANLILIERPDDKIQFAIGSLQLATISKNTSINMMHISSDIALLNAAEIQFPLILRPWKQGDYFYPLGMMKKKKLARFFIGQKISKTDKEKIWVVESNKKILWVVGHRIDERFKITEGTKEILRLHFTPKN